MRSFLFVLIAIVLVSIPFAFDVNNVVTFPNLMVAGNNYTALFSFQGSHSGAYYAQIGVPPEQAGNLAVMLNLKPCAFNGNFFICNETMIPLEINLANLNIAILPGASSSLTNISVQFLVERPIVNITQNITEPVNITPVPEPTPEPVQNITPTPAENITQNVTPPTPIPQPTPEPVVTPQPTPTPTKDNNTFGLGVNITNVSVVADVPISGETVNKNETSSGITFPAIGIITFLCITLVIYYFAVAD